MVSKCCSARMSVEGSVTMYYVCHKCHKPCDPKVELADDTEAY
jgi:hypothetical protein